MTKLLNRLFSYVSNNLFNLALFIQNYWRLYLGVQNFGVGQGWYCKFCPKIQKILRFRYWANLVRLTNETLSAEFLPDIEYQTLNLNMLIHEDILRHLLHSLLDMFHNCRRFGGNNNGNGRMHANGRPLTSFSIGTTKTDDQNSSSPKKPGTIWNLSI